MSARKAVWECAAVERRARKGVRLRSGHVSDQIGDLEIEAKCFVSGERGRGLVYVTL